MSKNKKDTDNLTIADLTALTREQLVTMVGLRGAAIMKGAEADNLLMQAILGGSFTHRDFTQWNEAKEQILLAFGKDEADVLFPTGKGHRLN